MKHVFKIIGVVVVVTLLAGLVLYFLNGQGYIRGPLSEWLNRMVGRIDDTVQDTQDMINEFQGDRNQRNDALPISTPEPVQQNPETGDASPDPIPAG